MTSGTLARHNASTTAESTGTRPAGRFAPAVPLSGSLRLLLVGSAYNVARYGDTPHGARHGARLARSIRRARRAGASWDAIAAATSLSRHAVQKLGK